MNSRLMICSSILTQILFGGLKTAATNPSLTKDTITVKMFMCEDGDLSRDPKNYGEVQRIPEASKYNKPVYKPALRKR